MRLHDQATDYTVDLELDFLQTKKEVPASTPYLSGFNLNTAWTAHYQAAVQASTKAFTDDSGLSPGQDSYMYALSEKAFRKPAQITYLNVVNQFRSLYTDLGNTESDPFREGVYDSMYRFLSASSDPNPIWFPTASRDASWRILNKERMALIARQFSQGLSAQEQEQLGILQRIGHRRRRAAIPRDAFVQVIRSAKPRVRCPPMLPTDIFKYPTTPHVRKHGPDGYRRYKSYKAWLRDEFNYRCCYCLIRERWLRGLHFFAVEHFIPVIVDDTLETRYHNLYYACAECNSVKQDERLCIDPCQEPLGNHLRVAASGKVEALTKLGERFILECGLDDPKGDDYRKERMADAKFFLDSASPDAINRLEAMLGYPKFLPDLRRTKVPRNSRRRGKRRCAFALRERGQLPSMYL